MTWIALLVVVPWLAAIAWICSRGGWWLLSAERTDDIASQASRLRAFGAR
jgi:hypothetical protein